MAPKRFPMQLYQMVNAGYEEIGWAPDGASFRISNPEGLALRVIPKCGSTLPGGRCRSGPIPCPAGVRRYFGHSSYASLYRSLNAYDFHKASASSWKHDLFHRDRPDQVNGITRKVLAVEKAQRSLKAQLLAERKEVEEMQKQAAALEAELECTSVENRKKEEELEK